MFSIPKKKKEIIVFKNTFQTTPYFLCSPITQIYIYIYIWHKIGLGVLCSHYFSILFSLENLHKLIGTLQ